MKLKRKIKTKVKLHPVMSILIIIFGVIVLSLLLSIFNFSFSYTSINSSRGEYITTTESIINMFSLHGIKYIFANTVANFANYKVLSNLIITLIGIGVMEKSGFLQTALGLLTRKAKKRTITFVIILICLLSSIMGDIPFLAIIPISGLIFKYGKRNPNIGVISSYAALTCGYGLSIFFTSIDSSLANLTTVSAKMLDNDFTFNTFSLILFMTVSILLLSLVLTYITENIVAKKLPKYEFIEDLEGEFKPSKIELKGLIISIFASIIYLIIIIYNIIPGLPLSGNFLNYRESLYIDKLFGSNSFFSNGFKSTLLHALKHGSYILPVLLLNSLKHKALGHSICPPNPKNSFASPETVRFFPPAIDKNACSFPKYSLYGLLPAIYSISELFLTVYVLIYLSLS